MKKAFLVTFCPTTRVVVDVPDNFLVDIIKPQDNFVWAKIVSAAREQIIENGIEDYLNEDTVDEIVLDEELPYPQEFDV